MFLLPAQAQIRWRSVGLRHAKILEAQIPDFSEKSGICPQRYGNSYSNLATIKKHRPNEGLCFED